MFGTPVTPYEHYALDDASFVVRYSPDASDVFKAATGRPLAHLRIILVLPNPDRPGHLKYEAEHYYDPPPFKSIHDAAPAVMRWMDQQGAAETPTNFPLFRGDDGEILPLPPQLPAGL
jgi:hypothetical protein